MRQEQLSIARLSLLPQLTFTLSLRHRLSSCDVSCSFCGADHWIEERIQGSSKSMPRFSACCEDESIMIASFEEPPQPLYSLLIESTSCMFSRHVTYLLTFTIWVAIEFRRNIRNYNNAFAFSSLGVKRDLSVYGPKGVYTFRIQGQLCHLMGSLLSSHQGKDKLLLLILMMQ